MISNLEINLKKKYDAAMARCVYYQRPAGKLERRLKGKLEQARRINLVCEQLSEIVDRVPHGKAAHFTLGDGIHELMFIGESLGCFIGLYEITEKLPKFIDNVPDYVYNAKIAAMSYGFALARWSDPVQDMAHDIMRYGDAAMLHTPSLINLIDSPYRFIEYPEMNQGKIEMSEIKRGLQHDGIWYQLVNA